MTGTCTYPLENGGTVTVSPNHFLGIIIGFNQANTRALGAHIGVRHVLPVYTALLLLAAVGARVAWGRRRLRPVVVALLGLWVAGVGRTAPQFLAYFNALAGGPAGGRHGGHRICVTIEDRPGTIREVADVIRQHGFHLQGILTSYEGVKEGARRVVIRTTEMGDFKGLKQDLIDNFRSVQIRKG